MQREDPSSLHIAWGNCNCTHKHFAADRSAPQKLGLALCGYMLNIGSPAVLYYLKLPSAPERIVCACHGRPNFSLHAQDLI